MYVDDIKLAGKKQNIDPMWKVPLKQVESGEPTSILYHLYLGCSQRQCEISKDIVDNYSAMFESRISAVRTEKLPYFENFRISSWSYDMEGGQGDGVPKAGFQQLASDSQGSRTCVCANTFSYRVWHTQGGKDELTSCRGTV